MAYKVFLPQDIDEKGKEFLTSCGYEIYHGSSSIAQEDLIRDIADCDAVVSRTAKWTKEVIAAAPKLKIIAGYGVGFDNIDVAFAEEQGIWVTTNPLSNVDSVAECTVTDILMLCKKMHVFESEIRKGNFGIKYQVHARDAAGQVVGIIGMGNIGRRVATRVMALGMKVISWDSWVPQDQAPEGVTMYEDMDEIFKQADFVAIHTPYFGKTLVTKRELSLMKPTACLLNLSRGGLVDECDLIEALEKGTIAGAALDSYEKEPLPADHPLLTAPNLILTPHVAGLSTDATQRMSLQAAEKIHAVLSGKKPEFNKNNPKNPRNMQ